MAITLMVKSVAKRLPHWYPLPQTDLQRTLRDILDLSPPSLVHWPGYRLEGLLKPSYRDCHRKSSSYWTIVGSAPLHGKGEQTKTTFDLDVTVQIPCWRTKYEYPHNPMDLVRFRHGMTTQWVAFCLTDAGLIQGILLASSQYFANLYYSSGNPHAGKPFQQRALYHRGQLLRAMSDSMPRDTGDVTDHIVAKGMFLAFNEVRPASRPCFDPETEYS